MRSDLIAWGVIEEIVGVIGYQIGRQRDKIRNKFKEKKKLVLSVAVLSNS